MSYKWGCSRHRKTPPVLLLYNSKERDVLWVINILASVAALTARVSVSPGISHQSLNGLPQKINPTDFRDPLNILFSNPNDFGDPLTLLKSWTFVPLAIFKVRPVAISRKPCTKSKRREKLFSLRVSFWKLICT